KRFIAWFLEPKSESDSQSTFQTYEAPGWNVAETYSDRGRAVTCGVFSADGELSATGDTQGTVRIIQIAKKERLRGDLPAHAKAMADLALSPDKKSLITGDEDGEVKVWNIADREVLQTLSTHKSGLLGITVSADGKRFATLGKDGQVKLWETESGKLLREWDLKTPVTALTFLPGGKNLLTANANASMYVLDLP
ncbi:MAG TPA: hypothetical protein VGZ47_11305, partial [Gemmataceae bacterium]|nr:hypothetical protein [Gemmataceae bacterium]